MNNSEEKLSNTIDSIKLIGIKRGRKGEVDARMAKEKEDGEEKLERRLPRLN